jgi:hypothetical protein
MNIDWPGIRAAAIALNSARAAAVQAAALLPPEERQRFIHRVNKRAYRERWLSKARQLQKPRDNGSLPLSKPVLSGHEVLTRTLQEYGTRTKLGMAKSSVRVFEHLQEQPEQWLCDPDTATAASKWAGVASIGHQWAQQPATAVQVNIDFRADQARAQELWKELRRVEPKPAPSA